MHLRISVHKRTACEPTISLPTDTKAHAYLSKLLSNRMSSVVKYEQVASLDEIFPLRHVGTVELVVNHNGAENRGGDDAGIEFVLQTSTPIVVESFQASLLEATSTRRSLSKAQIISHELFRLQSGDVKESGGLICFPYSIQLVGQRIPQALQEVSFRLLFELCCQVGDVRNVNLSFQCPIELNELFRNKQASVDDDLTVAFQLHHPDSPIEPSFQTVGDVVHVIVQITNRTQRDFDLGLKVQPESIDQLWREEDMRAMLSADYVMQTYFLRKHLGAKTYVLPLKFAVDKVCVAAMSVQKLALPMQCVSPTPDIPGLTYTVWLPPLRVQDLQSQRVLEFREYLSIKIRHPS